MFDCVPWGHEEVVVEWTNSATTHYSSLECTVCFEEYDYISIEEGTQTIYKLAPEERR